MANIKDGIITVHGFRGDDIDLQPTLTCKQIKQDSRHIKYYSYHVKFGYVHVLSGGKLTRF